MLGRSGVKSCRPLRQRRRSPKMHPPPRPHRRRRRILTTTQEAIAGPERLQGQGLEAEQQESGDRAIHAILTDHTAGPQTDFVATYRDGAYEVWANRGMIRFQRLFAPGGGFEYRII